MKGRPDDYARVVRANWQKFTAYIVSSRHPSCVRMAKDEVKFIDRRMEWVPLDEIGGLEPKPPWFMAVIVCPGDDLAELATWATDEDADRVHFYLHRNAGLAPLTPWRDAGLPLSHVATGFVTFGPMHKELGLDLSDLVYGESSS